MPKDHISTEAMRAYLLGQLNDEQAAALEAEYFVNRRSFLQLQSAETDLIGNYLDGKLQPEDQQRFEDRYLHLPELRRKVEDVRRQRRVTTSPRPADVRPFWRFAVFVGLTVIFGLVILWYRLRPGEPNLAKQDRPMPQREIPATINPSDKSTFAQIYLVPGLTKGPGLGSVEFNSPPPGSTIKLVLEVPGEFGRSFRSVQVARFLQDGNTAIVWKSQQPLQSTAIQAFSPGFNPMPIRNATGPVSRQGIKLFLPGSLFQPGDYIVKALDQDGKHETYVYRVDAGH